MQETRRLLAIMAKLRDPKTGCPWDIEQNFQSLTPHTLEEAYEVVDAIEREDVHSLQEELGDLLLQIVFYAQIAKEIGLFDFEDIARNINQKMINRHPHIFAQQKDIKTAADQTANWEKIKSKEKQTKGYNSVLDDIAINFPALLRAQKLTKNAAKFGFDWNSVTDVISKLQEEIAELEEAINSGNNKNAAAELGDILFVCANIARHLNCDAETALRQTNRKFEKRFRYIEQHLTSKNKSLNDATLQEMEQLWEQAKQVHEESIKQKEHSENKAKQLD